MWLLRSEASHRGLLFASKEIDGLSGLCTCDEASEPYDGDLTPEQWLDVGSCKELETFSGMCQKSEIEHRKTINSMERRALLRTYGWLYLEGIKKNIEERLSHMGAMRSQNVCPEDDVLRDLGKLWALTLDQAHKEDSSQARIGIFSDISQEETTIEYINVPFDLTFTNFKVQANALGIVRHLTKKHHPALAKSLFVDDSLVYHHPYPTAVNESDPSSPAAEVNPITRNYEAKDNGWHAHVIPPDPAPAAGMFNQQRDWRPINTEADWQSLLRLLKTSTTATPGKGFMRHKSVEDRIDFINRHREREELEIAKTGGSYTNVFLDRHLARLYPTSKLEGIQPQNHTQPSWDH